MAPSVFYLKHTSISSLCWSVNSLTQGDLVAVGVLSGNRNFEGRINPHTRANYLASPLLCIAYALAGTVKIDFETEPLGEPRGERFLPVDFFFHVLAYSVLVQARIHRAVLCS